MKSFLLMSMMATTRTLHVSGQKYDERRLDTVPQDAICLVQSDFNAGTKIITTPGKYKLCQDIEFNPNSPLFPDRPTANAFDPSFTGVYDENAYGLGFFAALAIAAPNVELYLNNFIIRQSPGHALFQRFFAVIELADKPFIEDAGPAQFVGEGHSFTAASNVSIIGPGTIGLSSHHGIHGNENTNVIIKNVTFKDFEVAAVSLNNVDSLLIEGCDIPNNRHTVPVLGLFSAARFMRPYGLALKNMNFEMVLRGQLTTAAELYDKLVNAISNVYEDVVYGVNGPFGQIDAEIHPEEWKLFNNPLRVIDGPCYAFVVHGFGPAVGGQGDFFGGYANTTSSNIVIRNNRIRNIHCWTNEVPAAVENGVVMNDARGAVLQFVNSLDDNISINEDGTYRGNVVADMQIMVAHAIHTEILQDTPLAQTGVNTIDPVIVQWAMGLENTERDEEKTKACEKDSDCTEAGYKCRFNMCLDMSAGLRARSKAICRNNRGGNRRCNRNSQYKVRELQSLSTYEPHFRCNGDSMHHVNKGMVVIRVEDTIGFQITGNTVEKVKNLSPLPYSNCHDYHAGASPENQGEQQGGNVRGISVAAVRGYSEDDFSVIENNTVINVNSDNANVIVGIDVQGDSEGLEIIKNIVNLNSTVGKGPDDKYIALRVRENCTSAIIITVDNDFEQEQALLNKDVPNRRKRRAKMKDFVVGHPEVGELEWKLGGCPFARGQGQLRLNETNH